ncbi:MAG: response regulator [Ferruginibacter sp.]|nr:response regulator [Chitinophagaceae bacterium]
MQTKENSLRILVIEDNPADFCLIETMLGSSAVSVSAICNATRIAEACSLLQTHPIDLVLLDLSLPDSFGLDSFLKIKPFVPHIPVIILTGLAESVVALETIQQGAQDYLVKGEFKADLLARSIKYSIERKNAEEKILASEEKYRQMFYKNPFPAWIYDLDNLKILEVNDAAIEKYGYEREEFLNLTIEDVRSPEEIPALRLPVANRHDIHKWIERIWQHKKKNGEIMLMEVAVYEINYFGKTAIQAQMNDVTEKTRLQKELVQQQIIKQRQITDAVLNAQEKERKGIGEELHDNINQILATSKLFLNTALGQQELNSELLCKSEQYISMAMEEIRKLSKALITPGFIELGLKQSIEDLVENIMATQRISMTIDLEALERIQLNDGLKITIYRIIQEQLNNILKHAAASAITIRVSSKNDTIVLFISDNGKGFDTRLRRKGIGLTNINSRAELFNGRVEIDSSPGNGCRLKVELSMKLIMPQKAA